MARPASAFSFQLPRLSRGVGLLLWTTFLTSLVVGTLNAWGPANVADALVRNLFLFPGSWRLWTLVTFVFPVLDPITLIFTCLMLFWFGADLESIWGRKRMWAHYLASVGLGGAAVSLLGLLLPRVASHPFSGGWVTVMPLLMGVAMALPDRPMNFFMLPPFRARLLVPITTGVLVLQALMSGAVVPLLAAFSVQMAGVALSGARLGLPDPSKLRLRIRVWWFARQMKGKLRVVPGIPKDEDLPKPRSGSKGSDNYLH